MSERKTIENYETQMLNEAFTTNNKEKILGVLQKIITRIGWQEVATRMGRSKESLYRSINNGKGNPELQTLWDLFVAIGLEELSLVPQKEIKHG